MSTEVTDVGVSWITALERAVNPALATPGLAEGVEFFPAAEGGGWVARKLPEGRYLALTDEERSILLDLDGERTVLTLAKRYNERHAKMGYFAVSGLLAIAANAAMLAGGPPDVVWTPLRHRIAMRSVAGRMSWLNRSLLYRKVPVSGLGPAIQTMYRYFGRVFFHPIGVVVVALVSGAGFVRWLGLNHPRPSDLSWKQLMLVGLFASLSLVFHELGHALAVAHFGRNVNKAGVFIMYGAPGGFVDTGDMWLETRRRRITVTLAGPVATLIVGAIVALLAPEGNIIVAAMATSQYLILAANATPLLKLDGYYVLMDALRISNLRERSLAFMTVRLRRRIKDAWREGNLLPRLTRTELILLAYGTAAMAWLVLISVAGIFLLPERMWQMGSNAYRIGTQHVLGPLLGLGVVAVIVLIVLQIWGARVRFGEMGRLLQSAFDRSHGWAATGLVVVVGFVVGGALPWVIQTRSETSATGWTHAFALTAGALAVTRGVSLLPRLRDSSWALPMSGLIMANTLMITAETLAWTSAPTELTGGLRIAVLGMTILAALAGGRMTLAALGADLRAAWAPALLGAVLCALPIGTHSLGGVLLGAGTIAAVRLLRHPIVSTKQIVDIPVGEELTDRRRVAHLRRAVAAVVEPVVAQYGALFGSSERVQILHAVNAAAAEAGWKWWFVEDGRFVDRNEGRLTELVDLWGASIERIVDVAGKECGRRVAQDAVAEAYLALPARLGSLVDEWLGDALKQCGCPVGGADDPSMAVRLALGHLVRVPLREIGQAIGHDAIEAAIGKVNAVATRRGWGRWFRANGQMVDEMTAGRDDTETARELLSLLYAGLTTVGGMPLTMAAVQHAKDTLAWELRATALDLLPEPWSAPDMHRRVRQRTPKRWPIPNQHPARLKI